MQNSHGSDGQQQTPPPPDVPDGPERAPAEAPPEVDEVNRDELIAELAQIEDRYKRALADLDNYRKRAAQEVERRVLSVKESVLRDWLEVVDSVERAIQMQPDGPCAEGLRAVLNQMDTVLSREGAHRIGAPGERFDPEQHEVIGVTATGEAPDLTVLSVERSGAALGDRLLRPAQVVVARSPEPER